VRSLPCPICDDKPEHAGETCAHRQQEPVEPTGFVAAFVFVLATFALGVIVGFFLA